MKQRVRDTSLATYRAIQQQGLLSRMRWVVYNTLFSHGPLTSRELDHRLSAGGKSEDRPSYHKRLSELERLGVIRTVGKRPCGITGRTVYAWDVTSQLPVQQAVKVRQPTSTEFVDAADEILELQQQGIPVSKKLMKVVRWMVMQ